jgi:hypothetical protein
MRYVWHSLGKRVGLVEGGGGESSVVGVALLFVELLLPLSALVLCLIITIRTLCYKMTRLTTLKEGMLPLLFSFVGEVLASLECGLEALDHKCHLFFIEARCLDLHDLVGE